MKYRILGRTGLEVSRIALGGFPFSAVNKARGWDPYSQEGRTTAIRTIHTGLDLGINYIDTAPWYGNGHSESIFGEALKNKRNHCFVASKIDWSKSKKEMIKSVEDSLKRLNTDYLDLLQFMSSGFVKAEYDFIMSNDSIGTLEELKKQGKIRWIGIAAEEAYATLDLIETNRFDVAQVCYNIICQSAANHLLNKTFEKNMGVCIMRPMTSGAFQKMMESLEPAISDTIDLNELCLKFIFSDSRVHMANIGMRFPEEVMKNVELLNRYEPSMDLAQTPRMIGTLYKEEDKNI